MALDKIKSKVEKISENAQALRLHCIKAHCYNSIQAVCSDLTHDCSTGTDQITFISVSFVHLMLWNICKALSYSSYKLLSSVLKTLQWWKANFYEALALDTTSQNV